MIYMNEFENKIVLTIKELAKGIKTGFLNDEISFNILEFIKRVPFKTSKDFVNTISSFMRRNCMEEYDTIMLYIYKNRLHLPSTFSEISIQNLYKTKYKKDIDIILNYMIENNIPLMAKSYLIVKEMYLNSELDIDKKEYTKK